MATRNMNMSTLAFILNFLFLILISSNRQVEGDHSVERRCRQLVSRFDNCIVKVFSDNFYQYSPSEYLNIVIPDLLDTLKYVRLPFLFFSYHLYIFFTAFDSGENLTNFVLPNNETEQALYLSRNVFSLCHDYNRFQSCLDYEMGQCLSRKVMSSQINNYLKGVVRRYGGFKYQAMRYNEHYALQITSGMDYLCGRKLAHLDKFRTCLASVFQHNKALGADALALLDASRIGRWTSRQCSQTQRFFNSLNFAVRRSCEEELKMVDQSVANEMFVTMKNLFGMALRSNPRFSPAKCRSLRLQASYTKPQITPRSGSGDTASKSASLEENSQQLFDYDTGNEIEHVVTAQFRRLSSLKIDYAYDDLDDSSLAHSTPIATPLVLLTIIIFSHLLF